MEYLVLIAIQATLLPVLLISWFGLRRENERRERILKTCLKTIGIIAVVKGKGKNE